MPDSQEGTRNEKFTMPDEITSDTRYKMLYRLAHSTKGDMALIYATTGDASSAMMLMYSGEITLALELDEERVTVIIAQLRDVLATLRGGEDDRDDD